MTENRLIGFKYTEKWLHILHAILFSKIAASNKVINQFIMDHLCGEHFSSYKPYLVPICFLHLVESSVVLKRMYSSVLQLIAVITVTIY